MVASRALSNGVLILQITYSSAVQGPNDRGEIHNPQHMADEAILEKKKQLQKDIADSKEVKILFDKHNAAVQEWKDSAHSVAGVLFFIRRVFSAIEKKIKQYGDAANLEQLEKQESVENRRLRQQLSTPELNLMDDDVYKTWVATLDTDTSLNTGKIDTRFVFEVDLFCEGSVKPFLESKEVAVIDELADTFNNLVKTKHS